ncbi:MAG: PKD domain-containing protein [Dehalococcoidia bacterium]
MSVFLLLVALLIIIPAVSAEEVVFTTSDTWPVPDGVTSISVILVGGAGGGGGGGGSYSMPSPPYTNIGGDGGGGGGSGNITLVSSLTVTPGSTLTVTIGSGGIGGNAGNLGGGSGGSGGDGGATSLSGTGVSETAVGGIGGTGALAYSGGVGTGGTGYHTGSNGNPNSGATNGTGGAGGSATYETYSAGGNGGAGGVGMTGGGVSGQNGYNGTAGYLKITYTEGGGTGGSEVWSFGVFTVKDFGSGYPYSDRISASATPVDEYIRLNANVTQVDIAYGAAAGIKSKGDVSNITNISFSYNWYDRVIAVQFGHGATYLLVSVDDQIQYQQPLTTNSGYGDSSVIPIFANSTSKIKIYLAASGTSGCVVATASAYIYDIYINSVLQNITVSEGPDSDFVATPLSGINPLTVSFMDLSSGAPTTWDWSFGDGTTSTEQNPSHSYTTAGNYTVSLTVANEYGSSTTSKGNFISVEGGAYTYPVTITDATTGYTISNSNLSASQIVDGSETNHYNATSATGKFTLTGYGPTMSIPIAAGDVIGLFGTADGYQENGWSIIAGPSNNGITQIIPLPPNSIIPKTGEFSAVIMAYDGDTSMGISGAKITVSNANYSQSKYTLTGGVASFKNMTATATYTATVSASGYSTTSKTFTGSSGEIKYVDIPMSPSGVNPDPTVTVTATPTVTGSYGPEASDDDLSSWIRSKATNILDFLYLFIILGLVGTILRIFKLV